MTGIVDRVNARNAVRRKGYSDPPFWSQQVPVFSTSTPNAERIDTDFEGMVENGLKGSSPVMACMLRRMEVFSQGRFAWQRWDNGVPQDPFGTNELQLLEQPWPLGTTAELFARCEMDASAAGNSYWTKVDDRGRIGMAASGTVRLSRLRPDWSQLIIDAPSGNPYGPDARVVGLNFEPQIRIADAKDTAWTLLPSEFAHYSPLPDPTARFRGMSWMTSIVREIEADREATRYKGKVFSNGAVYTNAIKFDKDTTPAAFKRFVKRYNESHSGSRNAFRTLFLTAGADLVPTSMSMQQLDFKLIQGAGEVRVCVASGVPAVIAGVGDSLGGTSLNEGNFNAARRLFVDTTVRHLWNVVAPSFEALILPPSRQQGAHLIVDGRFVPFLHEDAKARADQAAVEAQIITSLVREGFTADSAIVAVRTGDWTKLKHTGMLSVQLHDPSQMPALPSGSNGAMPNGTANGVSHAQVVV